MSADPETRAPRRTTDDVTCLACGCLCDDLSVTVEGREVVAVGAACETGAAWFRAAGRAPAPAGAAIDGAAAGVTEAVARAAELLAAARAPVVCGLAAALNETVRAALELADAVGARVVVDRSAADLGRVAAFQRRGRVAATLGEVRNRADLIVFWGADPARTHPRHFERYSVEPRGRFVPDGRAGRTVVVVDGAKTATAEAADLFVPVAPEHEPAALNVLRLLVAGKAPGPDAGTPYRGDRAALERLAGRLVGARHGALFFQSRARPDDRSGADWEAVGRLVRDLNESTRFVLLGMGGPGNLAGAEAVLTWQAGFAQGVDYRLGFPQALDDLPTLDDLLRAGEADAVVSVGGGGGDGEEGLSPEARAHLRATPRVAIGPGATAGRGLTPAVAIETAIPGFDAGGSVVRVDGVGLPVRAVADPSAPTGGEVLRALRREWRRVAAARGS